MAYEDDVRRAREAKARFGKDLLDNPDVHGVGIGYRRRRGEKTEELGLVVHVQAKQEMEQVAPQRRLPESVTFVDRSGERVEVSVDVVEKTIPVTEIACGDCTADLEDRVRPVPGGYSGGPPTSVSNGGTLGGWVWDTITDQPVIISNDHVFGGTGGTDISQPSTFDGGSLPADRIADVVRSGTLDASIASASDPDVIEYEIECGGPGVFEIADATVGMHVQKTGQTTSLTCGIVELIDYTSNHYGSQNDLWIDGDGNDFSMGGDSGSLYLEKEHPNGSSWRRVVGLHWGGSGDDGVGHPIRAVFDDLDLIPVCAGLVAQFLDNLFGRETETESDKALGAVDITVLDPVAVGIGRPRWPKLRPPRRVRPRRSFARAIEARLAELEIGREVVDVIQRNRVTVVKALSQTETRRAVTALLAPLREAVTTDDVLDHKVTERDLANVKRVVAVLERTAKDDASELVEVAMKLAKRADGATLHDLLR